MRKELLTLLGFVRRQIGLRTDPADAAGSLHAKVKDVRDGIDSGIQLKSIIASDTLQASATNRFNFHTDPDVWLEAKGFMLNFSGTFRVSFYLSRNESTHKALARVIANGVIVAEQGLSSSTGNSATLTVDCSCPGPAYVVLAVSGRAYVREVRVYYDVVNTPTSIVVMRDEEA